MKVIKKKSIVEQWVEWKGDVRLLLRPFAFSQGIFVPTNAKEVAEAMWVQFNYCIMDWEGIEDEDGNTLECNEENKKLLFDYVEDLLDFVFHKVKEVTSDVSDELGN